MINKLYVPKLGVACIHCRTWTSNKSGICNTCKKLRKAAYGPFR